VHPHWGCDQEEEQIFNYRAREQRTTKRRVCPVKTLPSSKGAKLTEEKKKKGGWARPEEGPMEAQKRKSEKTSQQGQIVFIGEENQGPPS